MNNEDIRDWGRFTRHRGMISFEGQQRIKATAVAIAGVGGIGSAVAMMLAKIGFGHLILCDYDRYEQANTVKQAFAARDTIGQNKVAVAKSEVLRHGPECRVTAVDAPLRTQDDADRLVSEARFVISGVDKAIPRILLSRAAEARGVPFVVPANLGWSIVLGYKAPGGQAYEHRYLSVPGVRTKDGRLDLEDARTIEIIKVDWDVWLALLGGFDAITTRDLLLGRLESYPYMVAPAFLAASLAVSQILKVAASPSNQHVGPEMFAFDMRRFQAIDWTLIMRRVVVAIEIYLSGGRESLARKWARVQDS